MKKLLLTLALTLPLVSMAQPHQHQGEKMTPEQHGILKAKALRLELDLSAEQEEQIKNIMLTQIAAVKAHREKAKTEQLSEYDRKLHFLDLQLSLKEQMKSILSEEQFENWKKNQSHKKRMAMQYRGGNGKKNAMKKEGPGRFSR